MKASHLDYSGRYITPLAWKSILPMPRLRRSTTFSSSRRSFYLQELEVGKAQEDQPQNGNGILGGFQLGLGAQLVSGAPQAFFYFTVVRGHIGSWKRIILEPVITFFEQEVSWGAFEKGFVDQHG
jgi:hypothetical protein